MMLSNQPLYIRHGDQTQRVQTATAGMIAFGPAGVHGRKATLSEKRVWPSNHYSWLGSFSKDSVPVSGVSTWIAVRVACVAADIKMASYYTCLLYVYQLREYGLC